jgi:15-cis-phytoene synthase
MTLEISSPSEHLDLELKARALCSTTLKQGSKSFALASRLLSKATREDAATLYTFCRRVDDAVDLAPAGTEQRALDAVRRHVRAVYDHEPQSDAFWTSFAQLVRRTEMPKAYIDELLAGMQMDVDGTTYDTLDTLLLYCHRVAGIVGLMMCHVLGVTRDAALRNAAHLGIALQLTNIARDVDEDWRRGRLYVPRELLAPVGFATLKPEPQRALTPVEARSMSRALHELLAVSERFYRSGDLGLDALPPRARFAVRTARLVYAQIAVMLRSRNCDVLAGRVVVPTYQKLWLLARAAFRSVRELLADNRRTQARLPARALSYPEDILPAFDEARP